MFTCLLVSLSFFYHRAAIGLVLFLVERKFTFSRLIEHFQWNKGFYTKQTWERFNDFDFYGQRRYPLILIYKAASITCD